MSVLLHTPTLCLCTTISASNPLRMVCTCITQVAAHMQHPCPSNTRRWFHQFLVIYHFLDKGGEGTLSDICFPAFSMLAQEGEGSPYFESWSKVLGNLELKLGK